MYSRLARQRNTKHKQKDKNNIPGGCLGPGKLLRVESCHGVLLRAHARLGLDTGHRKILRNKRNRKCPRDGFFAGWCVAARSTGPCGNSGVLWITSLADLCCVMLHEKKGRCAEHADGYGMTRREGSWKGSGEEEEEKDKSGGTGGRRHLCWLTGRHGRRDALAMAAWPAAPWTTFRNYLVRRAAGAAMSPGRGRGWKALGHGRASLSLVQRRSRITAPWHADSAGEPCQMRISNTCFRPQRDLQPHVRRTLHCAEQMRGTVRARTETPGAWRWSCPVYVGRAGRAGALPRAARSLLLRVVPISINLGHQNCQPGTTENGPQITPFLEMAILVDARLVGRRLGFLFSRRPVACGGQHCRVRR